MLDKMVLLKENETYIVLDANGATTARSAGVYRRDTRLLSDYFWDIDSTQVLQTDTHEGSLIQTVAFKHEITTVAVLRRVLKVRANGFDDSWTVKNMSQTQRVVRLKLNVEGDGRDLFAVHSEKAAGLMPSGMTSNYSSNTLTLSRTASDGVQLHVAISGVPEELSWNLELQPGEEQQIAVTVTLMASDDPTVDQALPSYANWRVANPHRPVQHRDQQILDRSIDDIRMLMMTTAYGLYPAAGMPHFVTIFGRDALITSMMLLPHWPGVAKGVLQYLAAHQGTEVDSFREEEPGKILHEMRRGELSRTNRVPFGRYYGSVDSTPLFLMALDAYTKQTSDNSLLISLRPQWELAAKWLAENHAVESGLIAFKPSGTGLMVQSWKDSSESMVHADGSLAKAPLAVAEVQGYAYSAFLAVAGFLISVGEADRASEFEMRAKSLAIKFDEKFWLDDLGTYAMAIDGDNMPLRVLSSDPGHLLWCGIVPKERVQRLVQTLMGEDLWSGWGLRTLGANSVSFNPVSYHNGSVWPHDTALFAAGLARYGFKKELDVVASAMFDLAASQSNFRLPELISGQAREVGLGPVQYTHACRPQAWAAASLSFLLHLQQTCSGV